MDWLKSILGLQPGSYYLGQASLARMQGNLKQALRYTRLALDLDPRHPDALRIHGETLLKAGYPVEGKLQLNRHLRNFPQDEKALSILGHHSYFEEEDFQTAIRYFEDSLEIKPDQIGVLYGSALAYSKLENYSSARSRMREYLRLVPNDAEALAFLANLPAEPEPDQPSPVELLEQSMSADPESITVPGDLLRAYLKAGSPHKIEEMIQSYPQLQKNYHFQRELALAYESMGIREKAIEAQLKYVEKYASFVRHTRFNTDHITLKLFKSGLDKLRALGAGQKTLEPFEETWKEYGSS